MAPDAPMIRGEDAAAPDLDPGRKVRTRQNTVVGNTHRLGSTGQGKCHRKQTAHRFSERGKGEKVR
jgi:hypothetical protein